MSGFRWAVATAWLAFEAFGACVPLAPRAVGPMPEECLRQTAVTSASSADNSEDIWSWVLSHLDVASAPEPSASEEEPAEVGHANDESYEAEIHQWIEQVQQQEASAREYSTTGEETAFPFELNDQVNEPVRLKETIVAIWDDKASDYKKCTGLPQNECVTKTDPEDSKNDLWCVWANRDGADKCIPASRRGAEAAVAIYRDAGQDYFTEPMSMVPSRALWVQRLKDTQKLTVLYDGHGPSPEDFAWMTHRLSYFTPKLRVVYARSFGCTTFSTEAKRKEFAEKFAKAFLPWDPRPKPGDSGLPPTEEMIRRFQREVERLHQIEVKAGGNQFHSFLKRNADGTHDFDSIIYQQSMIKVLVDWRLNAGLGGAREVEWYRCRTSLPETDFDRKCHPSSAEQNLESLCIHNDQGHGGREYCKQEGQKYRMQWKFPE